MRRTKKEKDNIVDDICELISNGMSAVKACREKSIQPSVYFDWLSKMEQYARAHAKAMECRSEILFDEIIDIAEESNADVYMDDNGNVKTNGEVVQRSKLKIDARKWMLGKMMPKKYGDKLDVTTGGESMKAPVIVVKTEDEL